MACPPHVWRIASSLRVWRTACSYLDCRTTSRCDALGTGLASENRDSVFAETRCLRPGIGVACDLRISLYGLHGRRQVSFHPSVQWGAPWGMAARSRSLRLTHRKAEGAGTSGASPLPMAWCSPAWLPGGMGVVRSLFGGAWGRIGGGIDLPPGEVRCQRTC